MSAEFVSREPVKVIADVLKHELSLSETQIMLENEKFILPPDKGMHVVVGYVSGKAISSTSSSLLIDGIPQQYKDMLDATVDIQGVAEIQQCSMRHIIQIDLFSFDGTARERKEEVIMALRSFYSQEKQGQYNMQIARMPSDFINASELEETKIINRFTMTVAVTSLYTKVKEVDYYKTFPGAKVAMNAEKNVLVDVPYKNQEVFQ